MDDWDDHHEPDTPSPMHEAGGATDDDEDAIRRYLAWIDDPTSLRDEQRIAELMAKIDAAGDPIEKIHLASDLHRVQQVDGSELRERFVAVARRWAGANGIVPEAFLQLGVPASDLRRAGFDVHAPAGRPSRRSEVGTVGAGTGSARRTTVEEIRAAARSFEEPFTVADLRDRVGGSPGTVRRALDAMIDAGEVEPLGAADGWTGPGRPPHRFRATG